MKILGIETSCDETSASVLEGNKVLSNIISSQTVHLQFGGVVPELASRAHLRKIVPIVNEALKEAGDTLADMDGFAVTYGPGLVGALLIGVNY
ncbi:MAG: tRNA (adenosine(37)-N6)-threonylcarbamoyltransferase complex transferase subunit TsaD, partial [Calditrichia bacterium]